MTIRHALIEKGSRKIVVEGKTLKQVVDKSQPIIDRNPGKHYRYIRLNVDPKRPWFKKGE
jgi:hypothetical protein